MIAVHFDLAAWHRDGPPCKTSAATQEQLTWATTNRVPAVTRRRDKSCVWALTPNVLGCIFPNRNIPERTSKCFETVTTWSPQGAETGRENKVTQESPKPRRLSRRATALIAAGLSVGTAASVAIVVPIATSSAQSAPTASIQVWMEANGTPLDNYWAAQAKAFDQANPGDTVSIDIEPSGPYNTKVAAALAANNPPALTFGWGGGRELQYIDAKVLQPFGDAGQTDAGNPSWKSDFVASSLGAVTFNNEIYRDPPRGHAACLLLLQQGAAG